MLLDIEVGTLVVLSISDPVEGMDVALELFDLALCSAEVGVAPLLAQGQDMAEEDQVEDQEVTTVVVTLVLTLSQHMGELTLAGLLFEVDKLAMQ